MNKVIRCWVSLNRGNRLRIRHTRLGLSQIFSEIGRFGNRTIFIYLIRQTIQPNILLASTTLIIKCIDDKLTLGCQTPKGFLYVL